MCLVLHSNAETSAWRQRPNLERADASHDRQQPRLFANFTAKLHSLYHPLLQTMISTLTSICAAAHFDGEHTALCLLVRCAGRASIDDLCEPRRQPASRRLTGLGSRSPPDVTLAATRTGPLLRDQSGNKRDSFSFSCLNIAYMFLSTLKQHTEHGPSSVSWTTRPEGRYTVADIRPGARMNDSTANRIKCVG